MALINLLASTTFKEVDLKKKNLELITEIHFKVAQSRKVWFSHLLCNMSFCLAIFIFQACVIVQMYAYILELIVPLDF